MRIFQSIEDFALTAKYDITAHYVWINTFLMWIKSPTLQKNWNVGDFIHSEKARALISKIIKKSNELVTLRKQKGALSSEDYDKISKKLEMDL